MAPRRHLRYQKIAKEHAFRLEADRSEPTVVSPMRLSIRASREHDKLQLEVEDTGCGFPGANLVERVGLSNTRESLRELYGADYRLEYGNLPAGGAVVRIVIPFRLRAIERSAEVTVSIAAATSH